MMEQFLQWVGQLQFMDLLDTVVLVTASIFCITVHETCHGLVAYMLGDDTAKRMGRLTLNPLHHIDVMGLIVMAVAKFGWAKPVPVDMRRFRKPKAGMALTALAGPVSNILLAFFAMLLLGPASALCVRFDYPYALQFVQLLLYYVAILSTGLAVFNLLPVPPLDGSKILAAFLPDRWYMKFLRFEKYGIIILAALLLVNVLDVPLLYLRQQLLNILAFIPNLLTEFWYRVML